MDTLSVAGQTADLKWVASNLALDRLIRLHRSRLGQVASAAGKICRGLESLFPFLDELCRSTCPWCPEPCCIANKVWIDFQDLLFMHLIDRPIPPMQISAEVEEPCRYLSHRGCALSRIMRPFACTQYFCPTQHAVLRRYGGAAAKKLDAAVKAVKGQRRDMEESFVRVVSNS